MWLVPPLATLWWTVPVVVVVEVGAVFTGFGAVVPRMSFITTDFAREVNPWHRQEHGSVVCSLPPSS